MHKTHYHYYYMASQTTHQSLSPDGDQDVTKYTSVLPHAVALLLCQWHGFAHEGTLLYGKCLSDWLIDGNAEEG